MIPAPESLGENMSSSSPMRISIGPNSPLLGKLAGILLFSFLCGCVGLDDDQPSHQALSLEIRTEMARCIDTQRSAEEQFAAQAQQLSDQGQQLSDITAKLDALTASPQEIPESEVPVAPVCAAVASTPGKMLVGRRESVWLEDFQLSLPARVDTGAETASLDARNIELFERDSDDWVRFDIVHPESGEAISLERALVRKARIVQASSEQAERRPVIRLGIVVGSVRQQAEFTLSNRSHLDYQVLIGRNILSDVMIVDVSQTNIAPPVGVPGSPGVSEPP